MNVPVSSMPASTAFSSSDSEGYLNVLRRRCAAMTSASLIFSNVLERACGMMSGTERVWRPGDCGGGRKGGDVASFYEGRDCSRRVRRMNGRSTGCDVCGGALDLDPGFSVPRLALQLLVLEMSV